MAHVLMETGHLPLNVEAIQLAYQRQFIKRMAQLTLEEQNSSRKRQKKQRTPPPRPSQSRALPPPTPPTPPPTSALEEIIRLIDRQASVAVPEGVQVAEDLQGTSLLVIEECIRLLVASNSFLTIADAKGDEDEDERSVCTSREGEQLISQIYPTDIMPVHSAHFESRLLWQGDKYRRSPRDPDRYIRSPGCLLGTKCICNDGQFPGCKEREGFMLMGLMTEAELEAHETTGRCPSVKRLCVLCYRKLVMAVAIHLEQSCPVLPEFMVLNSFRNSTDRVDGYLPEVMLSLQSSQTILRGPIAMLDINRLRAVYDEHHEAWRVDQSKMMYDSDF